MTREGGEDYSCEEEGGEKEEGGLVEEGVWEGGCYLIGSALLVNERQ